MVGGPLSGFAVVWSETAEREAARHMKPNALSPTIVRQRFGGELSPVGEGASRFLGTAAEDRQILADAVAAKAGFLITADVDDFAEADLASVGISAVNPDLFLAAKLTRKAYAAVIDLFVERQVAPQRRRLNFTAPLLGSTRCCLLRMLISMTSHPCPASIPRQRCCSAANVPYGSRTESRVHTRRSRLVNSGKDAASSTADPTSRIATFPQSAPFSKGLAAPYQWNGEMRAQSARSGFMGMVVLMT